MAIEETILGVTLGIGLLLVLLRYAGVLHQVPKAAAFVVAGLMFYVIDIAWNSGVLSATLGPGAAAVTQWLTFVFELIAFILILVGGLWAAVELIRK
ncbi:MAG TPA: hypothetical protein VJ110_00845 [Candidatus Nanoarchaeia archaeon]|nr:hypothetical protein [Candidatus Nanoarchaeia archaeon]